MLLRHLVSQFLQQQAQAKFMETMRKGSSSEATPEAKPKRTATPSHPNPLFVDGLLLYPSELDGGGVLDLTTEKETSYCESFTEHLGVFGSRRVALIEVGEGPKAGKVASAALQLIRPLWILSFGFASGLVRDARPGQFVMASRVLSEDGEVCRVGLTLAAGQNPPPGIHWGDLLTVDRLPGSAQAKQKLAERGATAWDADSYFIAAAATAIPTVVSVRIISEAIDQEFPKAVKVFREQKSLAGKLGAAAGALLDEPASLQKMWKLREDAIQLSDRLAKFLLSVVEQLPRREPGI